MEKTKKIIKKATNPKKVTTAKTTKKLSSNNIQDTLEYISSEVYRILGKQKENTLVIRTIDDLHKYIDAAIHQGAIAVDTETDNSLDPITCKLMGACIYTANEKNVYIPINHTDLSGNKIENQLTEADLKTEFQRLIDNDVKIIMHNGSFDQSVIECTCGITLPIYWDTMICARLLDENERAGLKEQYISKIDSEQEKYSIDHLFTIPYNYVNPDVFALYAATDAMMTYKLYLWQKQVIEQKDEAGVYNLFTTLEMPLVSVNAKTELTGIELDTYYSPKLSVKYHKILDNLTQKLQDELEVLRPQIDAWRLTEDANKQVEKNGKLSKSKNEQLVEPINLDSPTQLAILLYDVLKTPVIDKKHPRGTGEDILTSINSPLCKAILEKRGITKLVNTYIDKLPKVVNPKTGRLHCKFKQCGTDTGRFSSSDPNLQNIPSHNKEIRLMFKATTLRETIPSVNGVYRVSIYQDVQMSDRHINEGTLNEGWKPSTDIIVGDVVVVKDDTGNEFSATVIDVKKVEDKVDLVLDTSYDLSVKHEYMLVGGDYSAQEPRLTAFYSQDENMLQAYKDGKDLYAVIAQSMYDNAYEDNLEYYPAGTKIVFEGKEVITGYKTHINKEGKERRSQAKTVLLGLLYGRGAASIAQQINKPYEEGQKIIDRFYKSFPKVKKWIDKTVSDAKKTGYVEDWYGRRRHLPELTWPKYKIIDKSAGDLSVNFNPFLYCEDRKTESNKIQRYENELQKVHNQKQYEEIKSKALSEGVEIHDNTGFIAQAERQAVNSRVQGGAATLTKMAMLNISRDKELADLKFRMLVTVHDEILGECPKENAEKAAERLSQVMIDTAKPYLNVPMACDTYIVPCWYLEEYSTTVQKEFKELVDDKGLSNEEAFNKIAETRTESTIENLHEILDPIMQK